MSHVAKRLQFDELFIVSDLHFGGEAGFQIFASTAEFVALVKHVENLASERKAALVINGDFIDFLAEQPHQHFSPNTAVAKLDRVCVDPTFAPIFAALRALLKTPNRMLLINLGNHDLELALPWVQQHLFELLAGDDDAACGRIYCVMDGTGLRCRVANADALILHGNEFDEWNATDYHQFRTLTRDLQFGNNVETWLPSAGARMVIEVMNKIKKQRPFVDLLKPEMAGVAKVLGFVDASFSKELAAVAMFQARALKEAIRMKMDLLNGPVATSVALIVAEASVDFAGEDAFLDQLENPPDQQNSDSDLLGFFSAIKAKIGQKNQPEVLRLALDGLAKDQSFELAEADSTYQRATAKISPEIAFVITGHTHFLRAIARPRGAYFNSGTWARLIQVQPEQLKDEASFQPIFQVLSATTLDELDRIQAENAVKVVQKLCPVVHLYEAHGRCIAELKQVRAGALVMLENTRFQGS